MDFHRAHTWGSMAVSMKNDVAEVRYRFFHCCLYSESSAVTR